jgi:hypothetical protein
MMAKKRVAHTVDVIKRLFEQAEMGEPDAMELIGLWDELARLERKWRMQWAEGSERRKPEHMDQLNDHFDRLQRLIERSLRAGEEPALRPVLEKITTRSRVW